MRSVYICSGPHDAEVSGCLWLVGCGKQKFRWLSRLQVPLTEEATREAVRPAVLFEADLLAIPEVGCVVHSAICTIHPILLTEKIVMPCQLGLLHSA